MDAHQASEIAARIDGWMHTNDLRWLYGLALAVPSGGRIVELGSWLGRSITAILLGHPYPEDVYVVDTFEGSKNEDPAYFKTDRPPLELFRENLLAATGMLPQIQVGDSADCAELFPDGSVDLLFVDADHSLEGVRRDILAWLPKMKPGATLAGHDWYYGPIQEAVKGIFRDRVCPGMGSGACWMVKIPSPGGAGLTQEGQVKRLVPMGLGPQDDRPLASWRSAGMGSLALPGLSGDYSGLFLAGAGDLPPVSEDRLLMRKALCIQGCRIEHPADLKGDYVRGRTYDALRLVVYEPACFKLIKVEAEEENNAAPGDGQD